MVRRFGGALLRAAPFLTLPMMTGPRTPAVQVGGAGRGAAGRHRRSRRARAAVAALVALGVTVVAGVLSRSIHRVEVTGRSMAPALLPGDRLVVVGAPGWWRSAPLAATVWARWTAPGAVVAVPDPREPSRLLVKRVGAVDRPSGTVEVHGDDPSASTDSRTFGPVPAPSVVGRAVYRYGPPGRTGRLRRSGEYHSP